MTKELQNLINSASNANDRPLTARNTGQFDEFLITSTGEKYNGLWAGENGNGFNNMIVLARDVISEEWVLLQDFYGQCDAFNILGKCEIACIDIPTQYDCVRIKFQKPIFIGLVASNILGKAWPMPEED